MDFIHLMLNQFIKMKAKSYIIIAILFNIYTIERISSQNVIDALKKLFNDCNMLKVSHFEKELSRYYYNEEKFKHNILNYVGHFHDHYSQEYNQIKSKFEKEEFLTASREYYSLFGETDYGMFLYNAGIASSCLVYCKENDSKQIVSLSNQSIDYLNLFISHLSRFKKSDPKFEWDDYRLRAVSIIKQLTTTIESEKEKQRSIDAAIALATAFKVNRTSSNVPEPKSKPKVAVSAGNQVTGDCLDIGKLENKFSDYYFFGIISDQNGYNESTRSELNIAHNKLIDDYVDSDHTVSDEIKCADGYSALFNKSDFGPFKVNAGLFYAEAALGVDFKSDKFHEIMNKALFHLNGFVGAKRLHTKMRNNNIQTLIDGINCFMVAIKSKPAIPSSKSKPKIATIRNNTEVDYPITIENMNGIIPEVNPSPTNDPTLNTTIPSIDIPNIMPPPPPISPNPTVDNLGEPNAMPNQNSSTKPATENPSNTNTTSPKPSLAETLNAIPVSAYMGYKSKKIRERGEKSFELNKIRTASRTRSIALVIPKVPSANIQQINLDDALYTQREITAILDGDIVNNFSKYVNYVNIMLRKKHPQGDISQDEIVVDRNNFNKYGNRFKLLYGWRPGDNDRRTWTNYEYKTTWSFHGGGVIEGDWISTQQGAIPLAAPCKKSIIKISGEIDSLKMKNVRSVQVKINYMVGGVTQSQIKSFNISKITEINDLIEIIQLNTSSTYQYEIIWTLTGNRTKKSGLLTSESGDLFIDEVPL